MRKILGRLALCTLAVALQSPMATAQIQVPSEQIFGAEIQYFRLRGGQGTNIPRETVIATWARALDAAKAAGMNMVSFYIPWDFHEYKEGHFDFDGTADEDGDGLADYPSRDVKTFYKMIEERGFHYVQVRPGPYINAEWGFLGFGAIPLWFHQKYPDSHMRNSQGLRTKLYDYHSPDLLRHTALWFKQVYETIVRPNIGPGKLIKFLQVDNETNFMWQSIYNHDYGAPAVARYQTFLKSRYDSLDKVNASHQRTWATWEEITAPTVKGQNLGEDQDWYRFQDHSIFTYLQKVRAIWEKLGVHEPEVIFTLAESYNAMNHGLMPNHHQRNDPTTGLLTVNLYPKTAETPAQPFLNHPFKSDHDVIAQVTASEKYLGAGNQWVMGPEIQGGWWRGTHVSTPARRQTYLSTVGHGMKAMLIYYFHEGQNWQADWAKKEILPFFNKLKSDEKYSSFEDKSLPDTFWRDLQDIVNREIVVGFDVRQEINRTHDEGAELFFDAPLDGEARPRPQFEDVKKIGQNLLVPHAKWLGAANSDYDSACLLKDVEDHVPQGVVDNVFVNTEWESGLIGYGLNSNVSMKILHWGIQTEKDLKDCKLVIRQDSGNTDPAIVAALDKHLQSGGVVINLLDSSLPEALKIAAPQTRIDQIRTMRFVGRNKRSNFDANAIFQYDDKKGCSPVLKGRAGETLGYRCNVGKGTLYQVGVQFYGIYNSDDYAFAKDLLPRTLFLRGVMQRHQIQSKYIVSGAKQRPVDRVVAFSRSVSGKSERWVTVKNGNQVPASVSLRWADADSKSIYRVRDLLGDHNSAQAENVIRGDVLKTQGVAVKLSALGSTVLWIELDQSPTRKQLAAQ